MAAADYRLCDVCNGKAFYDSNLSYEDARDAPDRAPYRVAGEESPWGYCLGYLGDWAVLCDDCAKTHRTAIVPIASPVIPMISLMGDGAVEERIKTLMANVGMPDSTSLYQAMKQLQQEIEAGAKIVMVDGGQA